MKTIVIVQARTGSSRFPAKVLKKINNKSIIEIIISRLKKAKEVDQIVIATTKNRNDNRLIKHLKKINVDFFRGSENNVLDRFFKTAKKFDGKIIVRITADCPLVDPNLVDQLIKKIKKSKADYISNVLPPTFPDGFDVEVFNFKLLKTASTLANKSQRLNGGVVLAYVRDNIKKINFININCPIKNVRKLRVTIDYEKDFRLIKKIFKYYKKKPFFTWKNVINFAKKNQSLFEQNTGIENKMPKFNKSQKIWKKAKKLIPGGNMLLSKNPDRFLPGMWPTYFNKTKGCHVWTLDKKKLTDFSVMGVGTNILGYSRKEVDNAVKSVVKKGNLSTLNCPEEVELAEKLVELHPWAKMVKFARTGGEANSIAVRIARASTKRTKIAFCGYHGWHDWYISANLKSKSNLNEHLLRGLKPAGVPQELKNTSIPFKYGDINELKKIISQNKIGIIKMEVCRNTIPDLNFLKQVRQLANKNKIILIFDECTSGFRENLGGLQLKIGINPDILILGKALGNGYAITAILGKKNIMENSNKSFISSTFWTERIGSVAALETIKVMKKIKSWEIINTYGNYLREEWKKLSKKHDLNIKILGIPSLSKFVFESKKNQEYKTFITQEMLKRNFLASNSVYICTEHKKSIIDEYIFNLDKIFKIISECENGRDINTLLKNKISTSSFKRLN